MATREIFVRLKADASQFKKEMEDASSKTRAGVDKMSNAAGLMGSSLLAGAGVAVKAFADFDQKMSVVQAATMETAGNMDLLRDAALEAGARTAFSATEAAAGVEELAKAGVSTADILSGGLDGALDLAAAGGIAVGEAAETAASALTQFGLEGADVTHIADLLAAGASKAQGGVSDLGAALNQSGLVASQMGLSIEETVGSLSAFASAGLIGSDAGTSFKAMLLRLAAPTKESQALMDDLGIAVYDAGGEFIGMEGLAGQLADKLGGLDQKTRNAALATIFGQDAIRTSAILYEQGAEGVAQWISEVDQTGFAAEQASIRMNNLKGDWEQLTGAIETAMIGAGEGANGPLRELTQAATNVVNAFSAMPPELQQASTLLLGTGGLALLGVAGMVKLTTAVADAKDAMQALSIDTSKATGAMKNLGGALAVLGLAVVADQLYDVMARADVATVETDKLADALGRLAAGAKEVPALGDIFEHDNALPMFRKEIETTEGALAAFADQAQQALGQGFADKLERFLGNGAMAKFEAQVSQIDAALAEMVNGGNAEGARAALQAFLDAAAARGIDPKVLRDMLPGYATAIGEVGAAAEVAAPAVERMAAAEEEMGKEIAKWITEVAESDSTFVGLLGGYQAIIDKNREAATATAESTESSKDSWEDYYDGFTVGMQDYLAELEAQVAAQTNWEQNMLILSGRVSQGVIDELARLGPEGAPLVADLVNASDDELARLEVVYGQRSAEATGEFADNLRTAGPILSAIMGTAGKEAADEAARKLASGEATLQQVIDQYDLDFVVDADTGAARSKIQQLWLDYNGKSMTTYLNVLETRSVIGGTAPLARAAGGYISGPGTTTSDSIPARLSNGEYVVKASAVKQYGRSFFDSVNAQRFASGGSVGGSSTAGAARVSADVPSHITTAAIRQALDGATLTLTGVDYLANSTAARINTAIARGV
jgi:TP901 family phage tail tape measure protein